MPSMLYPTSECRAAFIHAIGGAGPRV